MCVTDPKCLLISRHTKYQLRRWSGNGVVMFGDKTKRKQTKKMEEIAPAEVKVGAKAKAGVIVVNCSEFNTKKQIKIILSGFGQSRRRVWILMRTNYFESNSVRRLTLKMFLTDNVNITSKKLIKRQNTVDYICRF